MDAFKRDLRAKILAGEIKNNREAYVFTMEKGHISTHAKEEISKMKREKLISYDGNWPKVNYIAAIKDSKIIEYKIIKK